MKKLLFVITIFSCFGAYYYNIEVLGEDKQIFKKLGEIKVIY